MQSLRGILLVVFSMAAFALEDALVKVLTSRQPIGQVILTLGAGGALIFFVIAGDSGRVWILRALKVPQVLVRTVAEAASAATFVTALSLVPISTVAAVFQATPLAVAAGAALVFGERVGWRRWTAIVVGFAGVLLIIRPGLDGFRPEAMLVLLTVVSIALRDLVTRRIPPEVPSVAI
ncbi:MAG: EamA family transporter, partial [Rhodobacteraceae bacterium]|nr:EamA family transporter [Paracoccaceae bacterium]